MPYNRLLLHVLNLKNDLEGMLDMMDNCFQNV
jgi:hypothetical protein